MLARHLAHMPQVLQRLCQEGSQVRRRIAIIIGIRLTYLDNKTGHTRPLRVIPIDATRMFNRYIHIHPVVSVCYVRPWQRHRVILGALNYIQIAGTRGSNQPQIKLDKPPSHPPRCSHVEHASPLICDARYSRIRSQTSGLTRRALYPHYGARL